MAAPTRTPLRNPSPVLKKGEFRGRNGEVLRREQESHANPFDFPESIKEEGWSYQWIRQSTLNNGDDVHNETSLMMRAGWRPVSPNSLKGYFADENKNSNHIVKEGMLLVERPIEMTQEAQLDAKRKADAKLQKNLGFIHDGMYSLPSGFEYDHGLTGVDRAGYEPAPNDLKPTYARMGSTIGD